MIGDRQEVFLLSDGKTPIANGLMDKQAGGSLLFIEVFDDKIDEVAKHQQLQVITIENDDAPLSCALVRVSGDTVALQKQGTLDHALRRSLMVQAEFDTYVYPLWKEWKGRCLIRSYDLSCGGISFFSSGDFRVGQKLQVVIPVTAAPIILRCQILRRRDQGDESFYATKFVDMCHDEERMVQHAVFNIQLGLRPQLSNSYGSRQA